MLASGQLTTPQNRAISPTAAPKAGSSPSSGATAQPNVAPMKKVGTISPPRKPAPSVSAVNSIFSRKAKGVSTRPASAAAMPALPAPLYAPLPSINDSATTSTPPASARRYRFGSSR